MEEIPIEGGLGSSNIELRRLEGSQCEEKLKNILESEINYLVTMLKDTVMIGGELRFSPWEEQIKKIKWRFYNHQRCSSRLEEA